MKLGTIIGIYLLAAPIFGRFVTKQCNTMLMESFDLPPLASSIQGQNLICPLVENNCCSYEAQLMIYKKWQVSKERKHIADFYKEFTHAYEEIFTDFESIEKLAARTKELTSEIPNSNCNKLASAVVEFQASHMKKQVIEVTKKAFKFLLYSRRGFYCALCDAESHPFFNKESEEMIIEESFCSKMVEESLNFYLFKYVHFMKISRLYSEFLVKCDLKGNYHPTRYLKHAIKFFKRDEIMMDVNNCKKGINGEDAMKLCGGFCQRFNPVKYDIYLEGELEKLFSYSKSLDKLMTENNEKLEQEKNIQKLDQGRKLSATPAAAGGDAGKSNKVHADLDENVDQVTEFNRENNSQLVNTIHYSFDEDLSTKHKISYDDYILGTGLDKFYNLIEYKTKLGMKGGIDFFGLGNTATITKDTAVQVFKKVNPESAKADKAFEDMLRS